MSWSISQKGYTKETCSIDLNGTVGRVFVAQATHKVASSITLTIRYTLVNDSTYQTYEITLEIKSGQNTGSVTIPQSSNINTVSKVTVSPTSDSTYDYVYRD